MTEWDVDFIRQFSLTITCDDTAHRIVGRLRPFSGLNTRDTGETRNVYVKDYQTVVFSFFCSAQILFSKLLLPLLLCREGIDDWSPNIAMPFPSDQNLQTLLSRKKEEIRNQSLPSDAIPSIKQAARYIHDHLFDPELNVARVLDACDISENTFSQRFRTRLGHTPHRYIQHRRIEAACALFDRGVENILLVGLSVGYNRYRTFLRNFKGITGQTPSQYLEGTQCPEDDEQSSSGLHE